MTESLKEEEEKEILLYSESYPLNSNKEREKVKPISQVHNLLKGKKLDINKIYYKPLGPNDYEEVKNLHKEWFPVAYPEQLFSDSLLYNQGAFLTQGAFYFLEEEKKEVILGLIISRWEYVNKYFFDMVGNNKNILNEINNEINYEDEAILFLSKQKYYSCIYIASLGVIDECRNMKIGTNLLKDLMNYVIYFPFCTGIYLNVITDNFSGKKFYEKNGLKCCYTFKNFYTIGDKKYDSDVYVKIFKKNEKDKAKNYQYSMMTWKQKCYKLFILKPYYFLVHLFLLFCLCRCFSRKINID